MRVPLIDMQLSKCSLSGLRSRFLRPERGGEEELYQTPYGRARGWGHFFEKRAKKVIG